MDPQATMPSRLVLTGAFVFWGLLTIAACTGSKVTPIPTSPWDASYLVLADAGQADLPVAVDAPVDTHLADTARDLAPDRVPDGTGKEVTPDLSFDLAGSSDTRDTALVSSRDAPGN